MKSAQYDLFILFVEDCRVLLIRCNCASLERSSNGNITSIRPAAGILYFSAAIVVVRCDEIEKLPAAMLRLNLAAMRCNGNNQHGT